MTLRLGTLVPFSDSLIIAERIGAPDAARCIAAAMTRRP
jgi:hypothetical protein